MGDESFITWAKFFYAFQWENLNFLDSLSFVPLQCAFSFPAAPGSNSTPSNDANDNGSSSVLLERKNLGKEDYFSVHIADTLFLLS